MGIGARRTRRRAGGPLVIIGGRLEVDNDEVFEAMRALSQGKLAVLPTASGEPEAVGAETV